MIALVTVLHAYRKRAKLIQGTCRDAAMKCLVAPCPGTTITGVIGTVFALGRDSGAWALVLH